MWPRIAEIAIGLWLLVSAWVLAEPLPLDFQGLNRLVCGAAIVAFSAVSLWVPLRKAHLSEIPIALWLLGTSYLASSHPAPAVVQGDILAALFLLNFAIIPSAANLPPTSWRELHHIRR